MRANFEKKGYNTAMLDELESQNDEQVSEMAKRVGMLKDVSWTLCYSLSISWDFSVGCCGYGVE